MMQVSDDAAAASHLTDAWIDIHDQLYGAWWESEAHGKASYQYNKAWEDFFKGFEDIDKSPSIEQILTKQKN